MRSSNCCCALPRAKKQRANAWATRSLFRGAWVQCSETFRKTMIIADLQKIAGRTYPAGRRTQNLVGGASPIQASAFAMGHVTLEPGGGQVPWHNQEQEEIYCILEGDGEMCLGAEKAN